MMKLKEYLETRRDLFNLELENFLPSADTFPKVIHEAMRYSIFAGGKRLRPLLCLITFESYNSERGLSFKNCMYSAIAIECLHTYTLIHDDLPSMDNDDFRRGRASSHKKFGENIAILAGDALNTIAFEALAKIKSEDLSLILKVISLAGGSKKVIGGQVLDILSEKNRGSFEECKFLLKKIHLAKTASLIEASIHLGGVCAGASDCKNLKLFGRNLGLAFQIVDDILDCTQSAKQLGKSSGKDIDSEKLTYPSLYGLDKSKKIAKDCNLKAIYYLDKLKLKDKSLLSAICSFMLDRKN